MEKLKLLVCLFVLVLGQSAYGQSTGDKISNWYWKERFTTADANRNAMLERTELSKFPSEFSYYLDNRNFMVSDLNEDGELSFGEMIDKKESEIAYRNAMETRQIRQLEATYPALVKSPTDFILATPTIAAILFENFAWTTQHRDVMEVLYKNKTWMNSNKEAAAALNRNLCWMASNPKSAEYLYNNQKSGFSTPELLAWKSEHLKFMRQNNVADNFYTLDGYKGYIKTKK